MGKGGGSSSSVSSIDSSTYPCHSLPNSTKDLSTDLRLGLSISYSHNDFSSTTSTSSRNDWPPIKPFLRSTLAGNADHKNRRQQSLFIKVYMEGIPIGRKLDLFAHHGYDDLVSTLSLMFNTNILCADVDRVSSKEYQVLTYEDKEGDWMMVGDVPWEMFVATVKRLKITRADRC